MKKIISCLLLLFICFFITKTKTFALDTETEKIPISEYANQKCGDKVFYYLEDNNKTLNITGEGMMYDYSLDNNNLVPWNSYLNTIEKVYVGSGVTYIGNYSFHNCVKLKTINISDSVTGFGEYVFSNCESLTSLSFSKNVISILDNTIDNCVALTSIVVDANNTKYDSRNLCNCLIETSSNTLIDASNNSSIDSSIRAIKKRAFNGYKDYDYIFISKDITTLEDYIFEDCDSGLTIYTDASSDLINWSNKYMNYDSTHKLTVIYNTSYTDYQKISSQIVIDFSSTNLKANDIVYVNGDKYVIDEKLLVRSDNTGANVVTTYDVANSTNQDVHTQYPKSMRVFFLEKIKEKKYKAKENTNFKDILSYAGASIRIVGKKGIRIITSIPTTSRNSLLNTNLDGYKVMEYGTLMAWNTKLNGQEPVVGRANVSKGRAYDRVNKINSLYKQGNGKYQYTNVLVGSYTDEECARDVAMRSYMIIRPTTASDSSKDIVIYGGTLYRSISYVALQNKAAFKPNTENYEYIFSLIKAGYPDVYDEEYVGDKQ